MRREQEPPHARGPAPRFAPPPLHLDEPLPREPDRVLPEASVTPTVGGRPAPLRRCAGLAAGNLGLAIDPEPRGCGPVGSLHSRPKLTLLEVAAAAGRADERAHIQLAPAGLPHQPPSQF